VFAKYPDISFDGEFYNHDLKDDFNKIVSVVRKQKPTADQKVEAAKLLQYHVYDLPSGDTFVQRSADMVDIFHQFCLGGGDSPIKLVETASAVDQDHLDNLNGLYTEQGYEGQMVRLDAPYDFDTRSKSLLKRKEFITEEFPILRIEEGNGNWAGYAKRVVLDVEGNEVGAGMRGTQDFAKKLLAEAASYKFATIRHFGRTPDGSLRFPVAIDFQGAEGRVD
jgi:DNA ligase-1